jgi:hypothetical protein
MPEKKFKQICECVNCGNEAEMLITCHLEEEKESSVSKPMEKKKLKGLGVCSECGNEADMWVDI